MVKPIESIAVFHILKDYGFLFQMTMEQRLDISKGCNKAARRYNFFSDVDLILFDESICALNVGNIDRMYLEKLLTFEKEIVFTGMDVQE